MIQYFIKGRDHKSVIYREGEVEHICDIPNLSDNQTEWATLINAMRMISGSEELRYSGTTLCTDSLLLFKQLTNQCRVKAPSLRPLFYEYNELHNQLSGVVIGIKYVAENKAREFL
jgi:ribonuclease HI